MDLPPPLGPRPIQRRKAKLPRPLAVRYAEIFKEIAASDRAKAKAKAKAPEGSSPVERRPEAAGVAGSIPALPATPSPDRRG